MRRFCNTLLLLFILLQSSFVFLAHTENGDEVEGYAEIVSVEYPCIVKLSGNLTALGSFQYAFSELTAVSIRLSEAGLINPVESALDYEEFLVNDEGVQPFTLSVASPSSEQEWNLNLTLWVAGVTEWVLLDEYEFVVNVTLYAPQIAISSFTLSNYEPTDGDPVTISANITNTGTALGEGSVVFYVNGDAAHVEVISLSMGASYVSTFDWTAVEGNYTLSVSFLGTTQSIQLNVFPPLPVPPPLPPLFGLQPFILMLGAVTLLGGAIGIVILLRKKQKKQKTERVPFGDVPFDPLDPYPKDRKFKPPKERRWDEGMASGAFVDPLETEMEKEIEKMFGKKPPTIKPEKKSFRGFVGYAPKDPTPSPYEVFDEKEKETEKRLKEKANQQEKKKTNKKET
jgi:hypothetical protein